MLSLLLIGYALGQIIMTFVAISDFYMYETTAVEFLSTMIFWPLYLLKNLFYALLLVFKD